MLCRDAGPWAGEVQVRGPHHSSRCTRSLSRLVDTPREHAQCRSQPDLNLSMRAVEEAELDDQSSTG